MPELFIISPAFKARAKTQQKKITLSTAVEWHYRGLKRSRPELKVVHALSRIQAQAREEVRIGESAWYE